MFIHKQLRCLCRTTGSTFGKSKVSTDTGVPPAELFHGYQYDKCYVSPGHQECFAKWEMTTCILECIFCRCLKCQSLPVIGGGMSDCWGSCCEITWRITFLSCLCDLVCLGTIWWPSFGFGIYIPCNMLTGILKP